MEKTGFEADRVFRALGDKHRIHILDLLLEQELNAGELLERVDIVQSTLSHHMKTLCESGLVVPRKSGKWTYYAINPAAFETAQEFLQHYQILPKQEEEIKDQPQADFESDGIQEDFYGDKSVSEETGKEEEPSSAKETEGSAQEEEDRTQKEDLFEEDAPAETGKKADREDPQDIWKENEPVPIREKPAETQTPSRNGVLYASMQEKKKKADKGKKEESGKKKGRKDSDKKKRKGTGRQK